MSCESIRERLHEILDDAVSGPWPADVKAHLASCGPCREWLAEIETLQKSLRALPHASLPSETLDAIWANSVRSSRARLRIPQVWRAAAAAVFVTALGATTLYFISNPVPTEEPTAAELARAEAQAELVFGYTARALNAARHATEQDVIADTVSPAVRGDAAPRTSRRNQ